MDKRRRERRDFKRVLLVARATPDHSRRATLTKAGADRVFREVASGARSNRAQLRRALNALDKSDVLIATRLDRLARSTRDLLNTLARSLPRRRPYFVLSVMRGPTRQPRMAV